MAEHFGLRSAVEFMNAIVKPEVCDALRHHNLTNPRPNFAAVLSVCHVADWVFRDPNINVTAMFGVKMEDEIECANYIARYECSEFGWVRDVANGSKHLRRRNLPTTSTGSGHVLWETGGWGDLGFKEECFMIQVDPGVRERALPIVLVDTYNCWADLFWRCGIQIDKLPWPPY